MEKVVNNWHITCAICGNIRELKADVLVCDRCDTCSYGKIPNIAFDTKNS